MEQPPGTGSRPAQAEPAPEPPAGTGRRGALPAEAAQAGSRPAGSVQDEPAQAETARAEPSRAGPSRAGPARAAPTQAGPAPDEPAPDGPAQAESARDRFERIHARLRMRICLLDYPPGARLSEQALAEELGISRTPLRRVLVRLEGEGLLHSVHGVGTFVTDPGIADLTSIYQLRLELAELLGVLAPRPPDAALWRRLRRAAAQVGAMVAAPDARRFGELNHEFFLALQQITANEPLRRLSERLFFQTARIWLKATAEGQLDLQAEARIFGTEVEQVLSALELGDPRSAALIHRSHISMNFQRLVRAAAEDGPATPGG